MEDRMKKSRKKYLIQMEVTESFIKTREANKIWNKSWIPYAICAGILISIMFLLHNYLAWSNLQNNIAMFTGCALLAFLYIHWYLSGWFKAKRYWESIKNDEQPFHLS